MKSLLYFAVSIALIGLPEVGHSAEKSTPESLIAFNQFAGGLYEMGILSECDYSQAVIDFAYPQNGVHTGWVVPSTDENSEYSKSFMEAADILDGAFRTKAAMQCKTPKNNKKCCKNSTPEKCVRHDTKNCKMDAGDLWCVDHHMC